MVVHVDVPPQTKCFGVACLGRISPFLSLPFSSNRHRQPVKVEPTSSACQCCVRNSTEVASRFVRREASGGRCVALQNTVGKLPYVLVVVVFLLLLVLEQGVPDVNLCGFRAAIDRTGGGYLTLWRYLSVGVLYLQDNRTEASHADFGCLQVPCCRRCVRILEHREKYRSRPMRTRRHQQRRFLEMEAVAFAEVHSTAAVK